MDGDGHVYKDDIKEAIVQRKTQDVVKYALHIENA